MSPAKPPTPTTFPPLPARFIGALGLSQKAHANIKSLDLAAVRAGPGVVAVLTAADIPGKNDCGPIIADDPILAAGLVQSIGQPIFAVIAESHDLARRAAKKAEIDYQELPAVLTPEEAKRQGSFVVPPMHLVRGDPAAKLAAAPHHLKKELRVGGQEQFYLEGQISYAIPKEGNSLLVHCSDPAPVRDAASGREGVEPRLQPGDRGDPAHGRRFRRQGIAIRNVRLHCRGRRAKTRSTGQASPRSRRRLHGHRQTPLFPLRLRRRL